MVDNNSPAKNSGQHENEIIVWPYHGVPEVSGNMKPEYVKIVKDFVAVVGETLRSGTESNNKSLNRLYDSFENKVATLLAKYEKETDPDKEKVIMQEINSVHDEWAKKDSENRKHLAKRESKVIGTIVVIAAGVLFFVRKGKFK